MGKKVKSYPLPPRTKANAKGTAGTAFDIKCFPPSHKGKNGPFKDPTTGAIAKPNNGDFKGWVAYFVDLVGCKLEKLNGLQFNLDNRPQNDQNIADQLGDLADQLPMGAGQNPVELRWPLGGSYSFDWPGQAATNMGFTSFHIDLYFENEPDYRMVINCNLQINATKQGAAKPLSSSSSYLATSSSG